MKKVAIIGLGWLGMPLALSLMSRGFDVVGSKTTPDGVDAARMLGIECYQLEMTPELMDSPTVGILMSWGMRFGKYGRAAKTAGMGHRK